MSYLSFKSAAGAPSGSGGTLRKAFSEWILTNYGSDYKRTLFEQRNREKGNRFKESILSSSVQNPSDQPLVGIVGGGFAGLYAGIILQSLGMECELFENTDRVGGRINTWYSTNYNSKDKNKAGLYGEVGGMRLPQFSEDMLPVQQLSLAVNAVLKRNGLEDKMVKWRKFYYDSPAQRMRFNNMPSPITQKDAALNSLNFGKDSGGDLPEIWTQVQQNEQGEPYLPINMVLEMVNTPFITAINNSFSEGFALMMQYDQHSMWDYLTNVFTLGDLGAYYHPAMGPKSAFLPWSVASYLETTNVGTGMYSVSFVEMVIAVYDWGGSKNPYKPKDNAIYMLTVDKGMQHFPDACESILNLKTGVSQQDGNIAQVQVGMLKDANGEYSYTAPNLCPDAEPPKTNTSNITDSSINSENADFKQRVFLEHEVTQLVYDKGLFEGHGGMKMQVKNGDQILEKQYPYVISTLPNGAYLNGALKNNLLNQLSFSKAQAIRECNYMSAFKAFITFKTQFWQKLGNRQDKGLGAATTDRPNRQIIYPSYGYEAEGGVLQIYCWAQDAKRLGALSDEERVNECLKGIAYLYPDADVYEAFAGYDDGNTTKTWFWDQHAGGGAFALFKPEQFKYMYPTLLTPEFGGCLNFAGEACSVHHGWIVGAMDSAYNAVYNILQQAGATEKIKQMQATWGSFSTPDIAADTKTDHLLSYAFAYNKVDRDASAIAPGASKSIYGNTPYVFEGNVPAFVADFDKVPQSMKKTIQDKNVLKMLNNLWDANVTQRSKAKPMPPINPDMTAVEMLENIYYGNNFQTIPKPLFWLKDDDEFARQQLGGFMPTILDKVTQNELQKVLTKAKISNQKRLGNLKDITYIADFRQYLEASTVIPEGYYLAKPITFFKVSDENELLPVGIQLEEGGPVYTPTMPNAENAWLLAKMQTNCAGQSLHDVGYHQLLTHQICAMVSISLFSEDVFNPINDPQPGPAFQEHPVFKLLRQHVIKTSEFQQTIYNRKYVPDLPEFPKTRVVNGKPGVYNIGFVYDLIFSCGRIGNYQLQDRIYYDDGKFNFLNQALPKDARKRGVTNTPFSYPYIHDAKLWYNAMEEFVTNFVKTVYPKGDAQIAGDVQLQRFFNKLIPAFNHIEGSSKMAKRFPEKVQTMEKLIEVLTLFVWQFSVQHTVVNDGAYNQAAFVPNASTLMYPLPTTDPSEWKAKDVLKCLPSNSKTYPELGGMNFMDIQINASVTGQGPYPETTFGRGILEPSIDIIQDAYGFVEPALREVVEEFYQAARVVGDEIKQRQGKDIANYYKLHPRSKNVPETVVFDLITPTKVMNTILT